MCAGLLRRIAAVNAEDRGYVHDRATTIEHLRDLVAQVVEHTVQVDVDDLALAFDAVTADRIGLTCDPGVVDRDVKLPELRDRGFDHALDGRRIDHVHPHEQPITPRLPHRCDYLRTAILVRIGDHYRGGSAGERQRTGLADARCGAGDQGDLPFEIDERSTS